ncbi:MAG: metallophosphoesterase, partial [Phycisphaerae bacterium]|nr:metallophosphoesterase [Phycisphaerae bacterium]
CSLLLSGLLASTCFAGTPWRFVVTSDSRGNDNGVDTVILSEIADQIVNHGVDFVLFPGDLVDGTSTQAGMESQLLTWRDAMQPVYDAGIGVYACRGNHEVNSPGHTAGYAAWNNVFTGAYAMPGNGPAGEQNITFSDTHKNAFMVGVDQYIPGQTHRVNQTWLDAQFAANNQPHIFVFGHEPAFKVLHSDCLDDEPTARNTFWASISNANGRTYFCGHDHFYDHARVEDGDGNPDNDVHQYIIGTAGAPLYNWPYVGSYNGDNGPYTPQLVHHASGGEDAGRHGYVIVEVDDLDVTLTWMERNKDTGEYLVTEQWSYTAVPEPASVSMLLLGTVSLLKRKRQYRA